MSRALLRLAALAAAALATPAQAICDAANTYSFSFGNQAARALAYATDYGFTAATGGGATRPFTIRMTQNGLSSAQVNGVAYPRIDPNFSGATGGNNLVMGGVFGGRTASMDGTTRVMTLVITFAVPVRDITLRMNDIDFTADQYRDFVQVVGSSGAATYTPVLTTPWGQSNAAGGTRVATNSSLAVGATIQSGITVDANEAIGRGVANSGTDTGTLVASFAQPVTSVTVKYGNAPYTTGEDTTGQQAIGFQGFSFCPMPAIAMTKTSTPVVSALGAFALPSNDVIYELTVSNTGGSPVDAGTIVLSDMLPARVTFRNLAYDGATSTNYSFSGNGSGVTLAASGVGYSSNAGSSYGYAPASGYDASVTAVRFTPTGTMAANSSFSIRFKAQIK